jgi:hypothetical protein
MEKIHIRRSGIIIPDLQHYIFRPGMGPNEQKIALKSFFRSFQKDSDQMFWCGTIYLAKKSLATGTVGERQEGEGQKDERERNRITD